MPDTVIVKINGSDVEVPDGSTVAVAILIAGHPAFRSSVTGEPRGPLCGMGVCFECRVIIDGQPHRRSCQILCQDGMEIVTA